jgi:hypothetical protein
MEPLEGEIIRPNRKISKSMHLNVNKKVVIDQSKQQANASRKRAISMICASSSSKVFGHDKNCESLSITKIDSLTTKKRVTKEKIIPLDPINRYSKHGFQSAWMIALAKSDSTDLNETTVKENSLNAPVQKVLKRQSNNEKISALSTSDLNCQLRGKFCTRDTEDSTAKRKKGKYVIHSTSSFSDESNVPISQAANCNLETTLLSTDSIHGANYVERVDKMENDWRRQASSKNIVHRIINRTVYGSSTELSSKTLFSRMSQDSIETSSKLQFRVPKAVPWLELVPKDRNECNFCGWDDMGVLLAAVYGHTTIRIYDWDTVLAADIVGKNRYVRQMDDAKSRCTVISIEPILTIDIRHIITNTFGNSNLITFLQWNPSNQDEIMIGSRATSKIYIINLVDATSWMQSSQKRNLANQRFPFQEICCNGLNLNKYSKFIVVESDRYALLTTETSITCYRYEINTSNQQYQPSRTWSFKPWQQQPSHLITDISVISNEIVLVGSSHGSMALLNWKKMQRTSSFTNNLCPTIIDKWISYKGVSSIGDTPPTMMGIRQLHATISFNNTGLLCLNLSWVTSGGWVMTSSLHLETTIGKNQNQNELTNNVKRNVAEVLFRTNSVRCYNNEGKQVDPTRGTWSLPLSSDSLQSCKTLNGGYYTESVPDVSMILPNRDNRVAGEQQIQFVRNSRHKPSIHFVHHTTKNDLNSPFVSKIPLSRPLFGEGLSSLSVHPSNEWIVIGSVNYGLIIHNAR